MADLAQRRPARARLFYRISRDWFAVQRLFGRRVVVLLGVALLGVISLLSVLAGAVATHDPIALNVTERLRAPSPSHLMGTDQLGRDVFSRVLFGSRPSLQVGLFVAALSTIVGLAEGLTAGYFRRLDGVVMRTIDGMMAFPALLLALAIVSAIGPSYGNMVIALTLVYSPRLARVVRAAVLVVVPLEYVEAIRAIGGTDARIIFRHILPNIGAPLLVQVTITFAYAVLAEAGLSFLGVGTPPETPSWGNMLSEGRDYLQVAPWLTIFPGLAITLTVLGVNLVGDGLRDALDPRLRSSA